MADATAHALAGAGGSVLAMALVYPLEKLRLQLQVQVSRKNRDAAPTPTAAPGATSAPARDAEESRQSEAKPAAEEYQGMLQCVYRIWRDEGLLGFYSGLTSSLISIGSGSLLFFYVYAWLKEWMRKRHIPMTTIRNLVIAAIAGVAQAFATNPMSVVNARIATQKKSDGEKYTSTLDCMMKIYGQHGFAGFFSGLGASLILVTNPAIQFVVYERLSLMMRTLEANRLGKQPHTIVLSPFQTFLFGALGKALATVVTYPYQMLKSRLQASSGPYQGIWHATTTIHREEGFGAFYRGLGAKFAQTVLNSAFMFTFYESMLRFAVLLLRLLRKQA